jgi:peptide/nickel transport system permease protein/oligopeptide transport system permease protein
VAPGLAIGLTVLAFNLLGDALRDALDPRGAGSPRAVPEVPRS